jgi:glycosyltransferase involved in cell wall biosynthesis
MSETTPLPGPAGQRPHLLYVAWGYPPSRGAGMYRALATANAFARAGWKVTVLTATRETYERITGSDPEAEKSIDPSIDVVRIPFDPARGQSDLRKWSRLRLYSPLLWNFLRWIRGKVEFPEAGYGTWRRPLEAASESIHGSNPVDLVIGSANPNVDFAPGDYLYRKHSIPYVMDHRDAWHLDVYTGKRVGSPRSVSARMERRLLENATEAWFVNAPIRDWHADQHSSRADDFHVVANGYDPSFLNVKRDRLPSPDGLTFGYLGTIYGPIPLRETLEGWRLARERSNLVERSRLVFRGRLGHFAEPDSVAAALLNEYRADNVTYEGPASKTQVSDVYRGFDALLLIISRSRYVTSGKVFEYAATGLPIAALHHPETAATGILSGHPLCFPVAEVTAEAIASAIVQTAEAAVTLTAQQLQDAQSWAAPLARDEQLAPRIAALTKQIGMKNGQ